MFKSRESCYEGLIVFLGRDMCTLIRSQGKNPTQAELQKIVAQIDPSGEGCVDFNTFMKVMQMPMTAMESEADLVNAFRAFDKDGNGTVAEGEFSTVMRTFGEPLNDEEVDTLMSAAAPFKDAQGRIQYSGFAKMIHSQT